MHNLEKFLTTILVDILKSTRTSTKYEKYGVKPHIFQNYFYGKNKRTTLATDSAVVLREFSIDEITVDDKKRQNLLKYLTTFLNAKEVEYTNNHPDDEDSIMNFAIIKFLTKPKEFEEFSLEGKLNDLSINNSKTINIISKKFKTSIEIEDKMKKIVGGHLGVPYFKIQSNIDLISKYNIDEVDFDELIWTIEEIFSLKINIEKGITVSEIIEKIMNYRIN